ncbi:MAG: FHA domain-containing protein [Proteobacteria bacterium]|nr:FHA domain-containing protein [Pseudomonadota bacterium]
MSRGDAPRDHGEAARAASGDAPTRRLVRLVSTTLGTDLSIELQAGVNRVGRQRAGNHIVLVSPQVSRWHAELEVGPAQVVLRDLGSANGTYVNGERVQERVLVAGDLVAFSDKFTLRVLVELQPETLRFPAGRCRRAGPCCCAGRPAQRAAAARSGASRLPDEPDRSRGTARTHGRACVTEPAARGGGARAPRRHPIARGDASAGHTTSPRQARPTNPAPDRRAGRIARRSAGHRSRATD